MTHTELTTAVKNLQQYLLDVWELDEVFRIAHSMNLVTHASVDKHLREQIGLTDGLVRFSVGIEDVEDLIADIQEALG